MVDQKKRRTPTVSPAQSSILPAMSSQSLAGEAKLVKVRLIDGNIGDHLISVRGVRYGSHAHGEEFYMAEEHAKMFPAMFELVSEQSNTSVEIEVPEATPTVVDTSDLLVEDQPITVNPTYTTELTSVFSMSPVQKKAMREVGLITVGDHLKNPTVFETLGFKEERKKDFYAAIAAFTSSG